jgi:ElaB/YqjD/DUF883 family membrane-anchored ribosome-binding protein
MASTHDVESAMLQRDIEETRASLERNIGTLAGEIRSTVSRASNVKDAVVSRVDRALSFADTIKVHPYRSLVGAAAAGIVVGTLWGRYRRQKIAPRLSQPFPGRIRTPALLALFEPELAAVRTKAFHFVVDSIRAFFLRRGSR